MATRRGPRRIPTNARIDLPIVHVLETQADDLGLPLLTYIEVVLAAAHDYTGKRLPEMQKIPLTPITAKTLQLRTSSLTPQDCVEVSRDNKMQPLKIEEPLLDHIRARAKELGGVAYTAYIRAVLRVATGKDLPGRGEQPSLRDLPISQRGGGAPLRRVS